MTNFSVRWSFVCALGLAACSDPAGGGPNPSTGGSAGSGSAGGGAGGAPLAGASGSATQVGGSAGQGGLAGGAGGFGGGASADAAGAAGSAGAAGGDGKSPPVPSAGCGTPAGQALASWEEQPRLPVNGDDRQWWVWLPTGYDPTRAYPVVFTLHGCGGPSGFIPIQEATGSDAIVVRGTGGDNDNCWTYGGEGDDVKFFDAMLAVLEAKRCVDKSRVFSMGYSSGGWMTNTLECTRGDKLRATGTMSGGRNGSVDPEDCKGKFGRITVHDLDDGTNPFETQGAKVELDRVLVQNHCNTSLPPVMEEPEPCARYQGCDAGYPVVACFTEGEGHDRQDDLVKRAFWPFFASF